MAKQITTIAEMYRLCRPILDTAITGHMAYQRKLTELGGRKSFKLQIDYGKESVAIYWNEGEYHIVDDRHRKKRIIFKEIT